MNDINPLLGQWALNPLTNTPLTKIPQNFIPSELINNSQKPIEPSKHTLEPYVTGASVIGLKYKDGVMLMADTLGSYGSLARFKQLRRLRQIGPHTLIGGTGEYADFQHLIFELDELNNRDQTFEEGLTKITQRNTQLLN